MAQPDVCRVLRYHRAMLGSTVSLFAVDLDGVLDEWRKTPLVEHLEARPRGRVATILELASLASSDRALPPARAAMGAPAPDARNLYEALVEDLSAAHVYDAPFMPLSQALASLARVSKVRALEIAVLKSSPTAYPADVRAPDGTGLVVWLAADAVAQAAAASRSELGDAPRSGDTALWRDLLDAVGDLLDAAAERQLPIVGRVV